MSTPVPNSADAGSDATIGAGVAASEMGSGLTPEMLARLPDAVSRVSFLDRWITRRVEEASAVNARIEQRVEHLTKAEAGLRELIGSLRAGLAEVQPMLARLETARTAAGDAAEGVVESAKAQVDELSQTVEQRIESWKETEQKTLSRLDELQRETQGICEPIAEQIQKMLATTREEAKQILAATTGGLEPVLEEFGGRVTAKVRDAEATLETRVEQSAAMGEQISAQIDAKIAAAMQGVEAAIARQVEPMREQIERRISERLAEHERRLMERAEQASSRFDEKLMELGRKAGELESRAEVVVESTLSAARGRVEEIVSGLESRVTAATTRAQELATFIDTEVNSAVTGAAERIAKATEPVDRMVEARFAELQAQIRADVEAGEQYVRERFDGAQVTLVGRARDFEAAATDGIAAFTKQGAAVVESIRAQVQMQLDRLKREVGEVAREVTENVEAERVGSIAAVAALKQEMAAIIAERSAELTAAAQTVVEAAEESLVSRIDALRTRCRSAFVASQQQLDQDVTTATTDAKSRVDLVRRQLAGELSDLSAAALRGTREIERMVESTLRSIEQQATTTARVVEGRLMDAARRRGEMTLGRTGAEAA